MINIYPDKVDGKEVEWSFPTGRISYTYMHGDLQRKSGYDCFDVDTAPDETGIYEAEVYWSETEKDPAKFFYVNADIRFGLIGLVVAISDAKAMEHAHEWFAMKRASPNKDLHF